MALKSLSELNRDFMAEKDAQKVYPIPDPATASAAPAEMPAVAESPESKGAGPVMNNNFAAGLPERREAGVAPEIEAQGGMQEGAKKSSGVFAFISNAIFYLAIILILLTVLTSGSDYGSPKTIFGFSYFTVMSGSMQNEIPKGSFILVKNVDPRALNVGDTVTYMRDRNTSITHKIVDIYENYGNSGARGFQTKGVNNANPDSDVVYEANIVGKVVFTLPVAGAVMLFLASNVYIVLIIFGLCMIISFCLRGIFVRPLKKKLQHS